MHFNSSPYTAGSDYSHTMITTIFAPQQTDASVSVLIADDSIIEPTEIFSATLSATQPHVIIGTATATVTILDDDGESLDTAPCVWITNYPLCDVYMIVGNVCMWGDNEWP